MTRPEMPGGSIGVQEQLDEITEEAINEVCRAFNVIGLGRKEFHRQCDAKTALRQRIRQLIEEARSTAVEDYLKDKDFIIGDLSGIEGGPND